MLRRLPPLDAQILGGTIMPILWFPFELAMRFDAAIASALSPGDPDRVFLEMGRTSADVNLSGPDKLMIRKGDPHFLLRMTPQIYSLYYQKGHRTYECCSAAHVVLRTFGAESVTPTDCLTVIGWHERALELSGAIGVRIEETRCAARGQPHCEYHLHWEGVEQAPARGE